MNIRRAMARPFGWFDLILFLLALVLLIPLAVDFVQRLAETLE